MKDQITMDSRKKNKKRRRICAPSMKKRNKASSNRKNNRFNGQLKDMKKLSSSGIDEVFKITWDTARDVVNTIRSLETPTSRTYRRWDIYGVSFYLKMCTCFGVDYQHLESATPPPPPQQEKPTQPEECNLKQENPTQPPSTKEEMTDEERHQKEINEEVYGGYWEVDGPFEFGYYSCGARPERIPYHLYMLVKEAVDIMNNNTNDQNQIGLELVETKIHFFCNYLHSHLPTDWEYRRDNASSLLASGYECPRFSRALYVPIRDLAHEANSSDSISGLTPREMANVMSIVHSRKTPSFWNMCYLDIWFYCKLCSCFGIDYQRLEAASEDDVCLMNVGY